MVVLQPNSVLEVIRKPQGLKEEDTNTGHQGEIANEGMQNRTYLVGQSLKTCIATFIYLFA